MAAESGKRSDGLDMIPVPESVAGLASSMPDATTQYGSVVLSPGMVISPGGNSFGDAIHRTSRRPARQMTRGRSRRVVQRNVDIRVPESTTDEDDPIKGRRAQPKYMNLASECARVPGSEIIRVTPSTSVVTEQEVSRPRSVDQIRQGFMDKIRTNLVRERAQHLAHRDRLRRNRIRDGEELPEDEPLLGDDVDDGVGDDFLPFTRPDHLVPASFFQLQVPGGAYLKLQAADGSKASSLVTVLSIWNTMMGTSLLSLPWAVGQSGLIGALVIGLVMGVISCYTAMIIVGTHGKYDSIANPIPEFAQLCGTLLGRKWELVAGITSLGAVAGAVIVYWVLMSNFLFNTVAFIEQYSTGTLPASNLTIICPSNISGDIHRVHIVDSDRYDGTVSFLEDQEPPIGGEEGVSTFDRVWNAKTVPLFMLAIFPVICLRSVTLFTKFNSLGTVSVIFILSLIVYWSFSWGLSVDFHDAASDNFVPLFKGSFPSLSGILALGLFIHSAIITIVKNNEKQENNGRDVIVAFSLVVFTYLFVGIMFYVAFPMPKHCLEDNFFNNFELTYTPVVVARALLFVQLFSVFPLICYIFRVQMLILLQLRETIASIVAVNVVVCTASVMFAIFMPNIGVIIRYSGAFCGFCMIFTLPVLVKMAALKEENNLTRKHGAFYFVIVLLGLSNLVAQFLF